MGKAHEERFKVRGSSLRLELRARVASWRARHRREMNHGGRGPATKDDHVCIGYDGDC